MNKAIVRLREGFKGSGYISLSDKLRNHYTLETSRGFIELPVEAAKRLESDPRIIVEYPDGTTSDSSKVKKTKKKIEDEFVKKTPKNVAKAKKEIEKGTAKEEMTKKLTKTDIKNMDKEEQINLLKKLGSTIIPKKEKGRIEVILQLQEEQ